MVVGGLVSVVAAQSGVSSNRAWAVYGGLILAVASFSPLWWLYDPIHRLPSWMVRIVGQDTVVRLLLFAAGCALGVAGARGWIR
jgi:hypothetical protein